MRSRSAVTPVILAAGCALLLVACSTSPSASPSGEATTSSTTSTVHNATAAAVISPAKARSVVAATMATNNVANRKNDSKLLASYETGSAFTIDDATYGEDRLAAKAKDPIATYQPFTVSLRSVAVARGYFLAVGTQEVVSSTAPKAPACATLLEFRRGSGGRWRIALEPGAPASKVPALAASRDGYAEPVSSFRHKEADALPGRVVRALVTEETTGALGPFTRSDFTQACGPMPDPREDLLAAEESGESARDLFSVARPSGTAAYALAGGKTLVIFTLRFEDEVIASAANAIEWSHAATKANPAPPYEYLLAAGDYSQVKESGELQVAAVLSARSRSYTVIGSYSGVLSVTGKKASRSSPGPPTGTLASTLVG